MNVKNEGAEESFDFQAALHSYFTTSSLENLEIVGSFEGKEFLNKLVGDAGEMQTEERSTITITEEYDRVYKGVNDPVLKDTGSGKAVRNLIGSNRAIFIKTQFSHICFAAQYLEPSWLGRYRHLEPIWQRGNGIQQLCLR